MKSVDAIVIGGGLTGLTAAFYIRKSGRKVAVIEKEGRVGGVIRTIKKDGFVFEAGPNTGVFSTPELVRLFDDLGSSCKPVFANQKGKQRWIWKDGKWHALPSGLVSAVRTPLFSFKDKIRILGEPFRKPGTNPDESLADMVRRRMGKSFLDYAVDPFISGVYAGDPEKLATRYALPKLYNLEQQYGSFIRGTIKKRKEPKDNLTKRATREVFSVEGGLQALTDALADDIGSEQIFTNAENTSIEYTEDGKFLLKTDVGGKPIGIIANNLVTTIGSRDIDSMLRFLAPEDTAPIQSLSYAKVIEVVAAYKKWDGIPLEAFGGLIPSREKRDVLGILFTSSIFEDRVTAGGAILSVFMGGVRHPEMMELTDEQIRDIAIGEIRETLEPENAMPNHFEVFRYRHAIPQYKKNTKQRLEKIHEVETNYPGLQIAGNLRDGIGMADRVKQGYQIAQKIIHE